VRRRILQFDILRSIKDLLDLGLATVVLNLNLNTRVQTWDDEDDGGGWMDWRAQQEKISREKYQSGTWLESNHLSYRFVFFREFSMTRVSEGFEYNRHVGFERFEIFLTVGGL
jgi:hypothetical protein